MYEKSWQWLELANYSLQATSGPWPIVVIACEQHLKSIVKKEGCATEILTPALDSMVSEPADFASSLLGTRNWLSSFRVRSEASYRAHYTSVPPFENWEE